MLWQLENTARISSCLFLCHLQIEYLTIKYLPQWTIFENTLNSTNSRRQFQQVNLFCKYYILFFWIISKRHALIEHHRRNYVYGIYWFYKAQRWSFNNNNHKFLKTLDHLGVIVLNGRLRSDAYRKNKVFGRKPQVY